MVKRRPKKIEVKITRLTPGRGKREKAGQAARAVILEKRTDEGAERKKILLMRAGVAGVMIIFAIAWIFNLKYQFKTNSNNNRENSFDWEQAKIELDKTMDQVKEGIAEIKKIQETKAPNTLPRQPELTAGQLDLLKGRLLDEMAASTTASSTIK